MERKSVFRLLFVTASLLGATAHADSGWTGYGKVVELQPGMSGRFSVQLDVSANPSGCREQQWFYRNYSGVGAPQMFELLSQALVNNKTVHVYVTGVCGFMGYSEISAAGMVAQEPED